jgi:hypothetical protein
MAAFLTRGEIISEGLKLGGNPNLTPRARVFLNVFLHHLERSFDWEYLQKEDTSLATAVGTEVVSLSGISDFDRVISLWQEDDAGPLEEAPWRDLWTRLNIERFNSNTGRPFAFAHDPQGNRLILYPIPDAIRNLRLLYMPVSTEQDTSNIATYDASTPTFPDSWVLVNAVEEFAKRWDNSNTILFSRQLTQELVRDVIMHEQAIKGNALKVRMDPTMFRSVRQGDASGRWPPKGS